jgi:hypothetical protein
VARAVPEEVTQGSHTDAAAPTGNAARGSRAGGPREVLQVGRFRLVQNAVLAQPAASPQLSRQSWGLGVDMAEITYADQRVHEQAIN